MGRLLCIMLIAVRLQSAAQVDSVGQDISLPYQPIDMGFWSSHKAATLPAIFIDKTMKQTSLSQVTDNYIDDAHVHLENTASYDAANPYLIAFIGSSYKWTKHLYDGVRIDNPLIPGDAAHHFPLIDVDLTVNSIAGTMELSPFRQGKRVSSLSATRGNLGGRVGFTDWFLNNISGHRSAFERQIFDIQQRPYSSYHLEAYYQDGRSSDGNSPLHMSVSYGSRVHVDQDHLGANTSYDEEYLRAVAQGSIPNVSSKLGDGLKYMISYQERDHYGAEYQYDRAETAKLIQLNTSLYTKKKWADGEQVTALHINALRMAKVDRFYARNVLDQDGEGLEPYHQDGRQQSFALQYTRQQRLSSNWSVRAELNNTLINHMPEHESTTNAIYFLSPQSNYASLHQLQWTASQFTSGLLENAFTATYEKSGKDYKLKGSGGLHLLGMLVSDRSQLGLAPSVDIGVTKELGQRWTVGTRIGLQPNRYDVDQIRFLSKDYYSGEAYYWDDKNMDRVVQDDEKGELAFTTGGQSRVASDEIGISKTYFLEVPITYRPSARWSWTLVPQYRQYRGTWSVEQLVMHPYQGSVVVDDRELFIPASGPKTYEVVPLASDRMESDSWLFDQPFYAGATFRFEHQSRRWFFSGSFTANMIVGYAGMGNGPLHNNINALSESTSDINLRYNQVGRLDTDRSFISRIVADYKYSKNGSVGVLLKYKDGQSFAYYQNNLQQLSEGNTVLFYQPEVKGDNPLTGERGRREDFFTNLEFRAQHSFAVRGGTLSIQLTGYNLLDFANETSEYIYGNVEGFSRSPLELQVPRSVSFAATYTWH